ncbi:hypothetical protein [Marinilabilia sp.]
MLERILGINKWSKVFVVEMLMLFVAIWRKVNFLQLARYGERDCVADPKMHELIKMAGIVHPWTPGRYNSLEAGNEYKENYSVKDKEWCNKNDLFYMPVIFPGFSWTNLKKGDVPLNQIPRQKGNILRRQYYYSVSAGAQAIYVAMLDEMDEGILIFKCTNTPPGWGELFCYLRRVTIRLLSLVNRNLWQNASRRNAIKYEHTGISG